MATIGEELAEQFRRSWLMLRGAVDECTDEIWRTDDGPEKAPARWALHVIEAADFYIGESPDSFRWSGRFEADWEGAPAERLPSRDQILEYLSEVEPRMDDWLRGLSDEALTSQPNPFPWTGATPLGRMLYLLRHNQHHIGQMMVALERRGRGAVAWA